ncbi:MAG: EcoRV family type II restriction endonuclease [Planctomycetaceae bacterium]|nr:EcoRV family type II restriction endonuclease [Planctomycetaceae bacterium]
MPPQYDTIPVCSFIDVFQNIYTIFADTKIVSKIIEIHFFPDFVPKGQKNIT